MIDRMRLAELLRGSQPLTNEEQKWIEDWHKNLEESRKKSEEYNERRLLANKELEQLLRKYAPKEYWSDGLFNSDEFKKVEKEVEERVKEEILTHLNKLPTNYHTEIYFRRRKQQIIRKEYGYDWYAMINLMPDEYWDEKHIINKKYDVADI